MHHRNASQDKARIAEDDKKLQQRPCPVPKSDFGDTQNCCSSVYSPNLTALDSLITNSFTLNSGGPRPVATSRRSTTSRPNRHPLAALRQFEDVSVMEDEESRSPVQKRIFNEDFSLYDAENSQQGGSDSVGQIVSGSPRTTCSAATTVTTTTTRTGSVLESDDEDDEDVLLPSADNSPVTFKVIEHKPKLKLQKSFDEATIDSNSMDSGYGASLGSSNSNQFRFVQPTGMAPRRLDSGIASPSVLAHSSSSASNSGSKQRSSFSVFNSCSSQGSMESMEEDYLDLFQLEDDQANGSYRLSSANSSSQAKNATVDISSLICGTIKSQSNTSSSSHQTPERRTPGGRVRRCLNMEDSPAVLGDEENKENSSPVTGTIVTRMPTAARQKKELGESVLTPKRTNLMLLDANQRVSSQQQQGKGFKRPEPLRFSPVQSKRYKSEVFSKSMSLSGARTADPRLEQFNFDEAVEKSVNLSAAVSAAAVPLQRAVSMNEAMIMNALSRSSSDPDLIGDFTKPFCLPLFEGRHKDLRSISVETMAGLVEGKFSDSVASFKIVDCRYPYEFEGGHIRNAKNLYTQEQVLEELVTPIAGEAKIDESAAGKRHILVFHCEFSSERGPKLFRFLRSHDRECNENAYPALHYPEIYLLNGGYKAFYESFPELCDPINYRTMVDPAYGQEYKMFRAKTKSWNGDNGRSTVLKRQKSRSRVLL